MLNGVPGTRVRCVFRADLRPRCVPEVTVLGAKKFFEHNRGGPV